MIDAIEIRGASVHNLKQLDVNIPLQRIVAICGVSGSGKSSLALGVLYAEGSRRYLESLSTYTRRRMTQASQADVQSILHVPAALALHQRPAVPGIRSTFGTQTELLNSLRLLFSRVASHRCPNGHRLPPSLAVAREQELVCPECGEHFFGPGAEELAFNSQGACLVCQGTGLVRTVDESTLVPDESLSIDQGAVLPWQTLMWSLMKDIARELGVRTDVPFCELTEREREIVFRGPAVKHHMVYQNMTNGAAGEMDFTYFNAIYTVENALSKVKDEKGMKRVEKFLKEEPCSACHASRLSEAARAPLVMGKSLDQVCTMTLNDLTDWVASVPQSLPSAMRPMAAAISASFAHVAKRLLDLGLGYLTLDRAGSTLSTGELQRMQLARAVRNRTSGVLYVLDEPSIGLHPSNMQGLAAVMHDLVADGNSVVLVDHDPAILREADWYVELGPGAGALGGELVTEGTLKTVLASSQSQIRPFLAEQTQNRQRPRYADDELFAQGEISLAMDALHTVKPLALRLPKGRLTVVTGVSGSGKTTLVLESLLPALAHLVQKTPLPSHIKAVSAQGIQQVKLIDASPIGINVRSTLATYANVHDELRKAYARTSSAKKLGYKASDFSYNTGRLRCATCDGTGSINLDVQFLPDVEIPCPTCHGTRYAKEAGIVRYESPEGEYALPELMAKEVRQARRICQKLTSVSHRLAVLENLGLGYLTLGEGTPGLSGGEAQRLKLALEIGRRQEESLFAFDEPTIGLHPLDVQRLIDVFQALLDQGATLVVIEHDLQMIANADYIVDMGPGGGEAGGRVVAQGSLETIRANPESVTGRYL
ncbi:MAG: hypothetical protein K6G15_05615 [Desulfovibrio sp.]|nr:hypothetical protein [Desulfovibrio sp.]